MMDYISCICIFINLPIKLEFGQQLDKRNNKRTELCTTTKKVYSRKNVSTLTF